MAYSDNSMVFGGVFEAEILVAPASPESVLTGESDGDAIYRVGLAYANGVDVEADLVAAHKWFNLAAMKGSAEAKICRQEMADMLTSDDIRTALKSAREWLDQMN